MFLFRSRVFAFVLLFCMSACYGMKNDLLSTLQDKDQFKNSELFRLLKLAIVNNDVTCIAFLLNEIDRQLLRNINQVMSHSNNAYQYKKIDSLGCMLVLKSLKRDDEKNYKIINKALNNLYIVGLQSEVILFLLNDKHVLDRYKESLQLVKQFLKKIEALLEFLGSA